MKPRGSRTAAVPTENKTLSGGNTTLNSHSNEFGDLRKKNCPVVNAQHNRVHFLRSRPQCATPALRPPRLLARCRQHSRWCLLVKRNASATTANACSSSPFLTIAENTAPDRGSSTSSMGFARASPVPRPRKKQSMSGRTSCGTRGGLIWYTSNPRSETVGGTWCLAHVSRCASPSSSATRFGNSSQCRPES